MALLVVEENIRPKGTQERPLLLAPQKQRLVDANVPGPQGPDHPLVRRCGTGGNQCGANGRFVGA